MAPVLAKFVQHNDLRKVGGRWWNGQEREGGPTGGPAQVGGGAQIQPLGQPSAAWTQSGGLDLHLLEAYPGIMGTNTIP